MSATAVALALAMLSHPRLAAGSTLGPAQELWLNNVQTADFVRIVLEQYWMPGIGEQIYLSLRNAWHLVTVQGHGRYKDALGRRDVKCNCERHCLWPEVVCAVCV
jgi:hypothetical protein